MPTNLVRDTIAAGWRQATDKLIAEAQEYGRRAERAAMFSYLDRPAPTVDSGYYDMLAWEAELYRAVAWVETAIGQHQDAFYRREYAERDFCTCMAREGEPLCLTCQQTTTNQTEPY